MKPLAIKLGFLPANRGFFDQGLARAMREKILTVAADLGVELVCPTEMQTSGGCVGNRSEARICAELFDREAVDGVVVSAVNFGDEQEDLGYVHACENQRGIPGRGQVPWAAFFRALAEVNYDGCVTIESFDPNMAEIARLCCIWRKLADSPEQLATEGLAFLKNVQATILAKTDA